MPQTLKGNIFTGGTLLKETAVITTVLMGLLLTRHVMAHGYVTDPPERAYACRLALNSNCGAAQYEPQSVGEGPKGFPTAGPVDGKIPSAGNSAYAEMDIQTANRWHLNEIKKRTVEFSWFYTAAHRTTRWEYFVTKTGWNQNAPLKRASFDAIPFCTVQGNGDAPINGTVGGTGPGKHTHKCSIPADRIGHHVILAIWTVDDTAAAFHKVIDINVTASDGPNEPTDGWNSVGNIVPNRTLQVGDQVLARAFIGGTESTQYSAGIKVESTEEGLPQNWSFKLAQKLNSIQTLVRAGVRDNQGNIEPTKGTNILFAKPESGVTSYQLNTELVGDADAYLHFHHIAPQHTLVKGQVSIPFTVMTNRSLSVEASVIDAANKQVGYTKQLIDATTTKMSVLVVSSPGPHQVLLVGTNADGRVSLQDSKRINVIGEAGNGEHALEFPNGLADYKAGTKVLQPKDGKVYQCRPFPYSGWCKVYKPEANHYEPGVGAAWQDAWIAL